MQTYMYTHVWRQMLHMCIYTLNHGSRCTSHVGIYYNGWGGVGKTTTKK